jgi:hypothetical protein
LEGVGTICGCHWTNRCLPKLPTCTFRRKTEKTINECSTDNQRDFDRPQAATMVNDCPMQAHRAVFSTRPRKKKLLASFSSI